MQGDIDAWLVKYNTERPHQGRGMDGRTPYQAFKDGLDWQEEAEAGTPTEVA